MFNLIRKINWVYISRLGITPDVSQADKGRYKVYNQLVAISFIAFFLFIPFSGIVSSMTYFLINSLTCVGLIFCLWLNKRSRYKISQAVFLFNLIVSLSAISLLLGSESGVFLSLIPIGIMPLLFFKTKTASIVPLVICILAVAFLSTNQFSNYQIEIQLWKTNFLFNFTIATVLIIGFFYNVFFKISSDHKDKRLIYLNQLNSERNAEILENIKMASDIQRNLLPFESFFKSIFPSAFVFYLPRDIVSGDFYWVEQIGDRKYCAIIDCTGHGVPGSFVSILAHQGLNRCIHDLNLSEPADIMNKLHDIIFHVLRKEDNEILDGMDMSVIAIDSSSDTITFSGGHNSMLLIRENDLSLGGLEPDYRGINHSLFKISGQRQSVGSENLREPFVQTAFQFLSADKVYFYTDGYVDQFGGSRQKKMMHKPFKKLLLSIQQLEMDRQAMEVKKYYEKWRGEVMQVDDVCVVGIKLKE